MRCPSCGATNPDTADWCGQCYRRFDEEPAGGTPESTQAGEHSDPATPQAVRPADAATAAAGFRREGDELQWECPECGTFNGIELQACAVCGTSFLQRFATDEPQPPAHNWSAALLLSALAPGAGHLAVGRYGTGWARLLLFGAWVVGAILLTTSAGSGALVAAAPLLLGALVLWALTLLDLFRLQQGEREVLSGRAFLWLVVGVLLLMGVALFGSVGTATTPGG